jgi:2-amino-4-hydroxy-6-hydroxymethyldihydropteridine diphosphokinase
MKQALVGLGSNVEEPLTQLTTAYRRLAADPEITVEATSSVYLSAPHGPQDQPDFYNAVISLHTSMAPEKLLSALLATETKMGRKRLRHWGERCIDLDLLAYDGFEITSTDLVLPHPRAHERRFVLDPMIELLGEDYCLSGTSTLQALQAQCAGQTIRVLCEFPR